MRLLKLLVAFALCMSLTVVVSAHSGRTDSNGGHYDHSTGDYHYHHGYSAHDHYDVDGDGDVDCPYEYEYNYDPSPGSSDAYFGIIRIPSWDEIVEAHEEMYGQTEPPTEEPEEDHSEKKNNKTVFHHIWDLICGLWDILCRIIYLFIGWCCLAAVCVVVEEIWKRIKRK